MSVIPSDDSYCTPTSLTRRRGSRAAGGLPPVLGFLHHLPSPPSGCPYWKGRVLGQWKVEGVPKTTKLDNKSAKGDAHGRRYYLIRETMSILTSARKNLQERLPSVRLPEAAKPVENIQKAQQDPLERIRDRIVESQGFMFLGCGCFVQLNENALKLLDAPSLIQSACGMAGVCHHRKIH